MLKVRGLVRTFVDPRPAQVLRGVDLDLAPGEAVAITGPSGSGKSTLLAILGGMDRPTEGLVELDGRSLADLRGDEAARLRAERIGFVFQDHHLLPQCTALENALLPAMAAGGRRGAAAARGRAAELLDRVGLADHADHLPSQLSVGQRQRVALVRALINTPCLLLADEPTGALDHLASTRLVDLLLEINREQRTVMVVATHADAVARRMDRVLVLHEGLLVTHSGEDRAVP
jgi:lipoprotein-releasing system ATP-binding protein